jgi:hypothetical protein
VVGKAHHPWRHREVEPTHEGEAITGLRHRGLGELLIPRAHPGDVRMLFDRRVGVAMTPTSFLETGAFPLLNIMRRFVGYV